MTIRGFWEPSKNVLKTVTPAWLWGQSWRALSVIRRLECELAAGKTQRTFYKYFYNKRNNKHHEKNREKKNFYKHHFFFFFCLTSFIVTSFSQVAVVSLWSQYLVSAGWNVFVSNFQSKGFLKSSVVPLWLIPSPCPWTTQLSLLPSPPLSSPPFPFPSLPLSPSRGISNLTSIMAL